MVQIGSQIDLRMTPESTLPDHPQTGPEITLRSPISRPQISYSQNMALFNVLLTVAEIKEVRSKDWIRAPTCCQEYHNGC